MRYGTVVLDPPWRYENSRGTQTRAMHGREATTAEGNYPVMTNEEIAALPVPDLAAKDCALYMWVTNPRLFGHRATYIESPTPAEIVDGWGFRYITLLTWVKTGAPGMGFHFRGHTEHVIYAIRGKVKIPPELRTSNVITAPRRGHSQKPEAFLDLVERISPGPYVELFARRNRFGWDTWGNECFSHVDLVGAASGSLESEGQ